MKRDLDGKQFTCVELSFIRFKQFTQQFNDNFKGGVKND